MVFKNLVNRIRNSETARASAVFGCLALTPVMGWSALTASDFIAIQEPLLGQDAACKKARETNWSSLLDSMPAGEYHPAHRAIAAPFSAAYKVGADAYELVRCSSSR